VQASTGGSANAWDNGYPSGGNYWSDYLTKYPNAAENDSSGIWNTPYVINASNTDRYPLMAPFHTLNAGTWNNTSYSVSIVSNSTVTGFSFNAAGKTITFTVTGQTGTVGFCRVAIPTSLLWCDNNAQWTVMVGGTLVGNRTVNVSGNYTYIYFSYTHSTHQVTITGIHAVPEFQPLFFSPIFITAILLATLLAALILKRKRNARTRALDSD
jgi:hypothetical protein